MEDDFPVIIYDVSTFLKASSIDQGAKKLNFANVSHSYMFSTSRRNLRISSRSLFLFASCVIFKVFAVNIVTTKAQKKNNWEASAEIRLKLKLENITMGTQKMNVPSVTRWRKQSANTRRFQIGDDISQTIQPEPLQF